MKKITFNATKFLDYQLENILRLVNDNSKLYLEIGGKIIDDYNAGRILSGYDVDCKLKLLKKISAKTEIILVISAHDIINNRFLTNSGLSYDKELLRLINILKRNKISINHLAISYWDDMYKSNIKIKKILKYFVNKKMQVHTFYPIESEYIGKQEQQILMNNDFIKSSKKIFAVISPGGGSGKFQICLNQLYHEMKHGHHPIFQSISSFPVKNLPPKHPLNLAYMAASADFFRICLIDKNNTITNYDLSNFNLLKQLVKLFPKCSNYLKKIKSAKDMNHNYISKCIINMKEAKTQAIYEIRNRFNKYQKDRYKKYFALTAMQHGAPAAIFKEIYKYLS